MPKKTNTSNDIKKIKVTKYVNTNILLSLKCHVIPVSRPFVELYSLSLALFGVSFMLCSQGFMLLPNLQLIEKPKK